MKHCMMLTAMITMGLTLTLTLGCEQQGGDAATPAAPAADAPEQVDFEAQARETISTENADQALEDLESEIESDTADVTVE